MWWWFWVVLAHFPPWFCTFCMIAMHRFLISKSTGRTTILVKKSKKFPLLLLGQNILGLLWSNLFRCVVHCGSVRLTSNDQYLMSCLSCYTNYRTLQRPKFYPPKVQTKPKVAANSWGTESNLCRGENARQNMFCYSICKSSGSNKMFQQPVKWWLF